MRCTVYTCTSTAQASSGCLSECARVFDAPCPRVLQRASKQGAVVVSECARFAGYAMHRMAFPNGDEFLPDRWLDGNAHLRPPNENLVRDVIVFIRTHTHTLSLSLSLSLSLLHDTVECVCVHTHTRNPPPTHHHRTHNPHARHIPGACHCVFVCVHTPPSHTTTQTPQRHPFDLCVLFLSFFPFSLFFALSSSFFRSFFCQSFL
jgi:hypothetical protein